MHQRKGTLEHTDESVGVDEGCYVVAIVVGADEVGVAELLLRPLLQDAHNRLLRHEGLYVDGGESDESHHRLQQDCPVLGLQPMLQPHIQLLQQSVEEIVVMMDFLRVLSPQLFVEDQSCCPDLPRQQRTFRSLSEHIHHTIYLMLKG